MIGAEFSKKVGKTTGAVISRIGSKSHEVLNTSQTEPAGALPVDRFGSMTMARRTRLGLASLLASGFVLMACSSSDGGSATTKAKSTGWQEVELVDVDGTSFSVSDLKGKPVVVENFATWCSNCRKQLGDTQKAAAAAGQDAVFLALSVETDLDAKTVAAYAKENGFSDVRFAVMTPEMLGAMDDAYGKSALNPPITPKIVVDAAGKAGELVTGFESPSDLAARLEAGA